MYGFVLGMWKIRKIDEIKVQSYFPKYIKTQEEIDAILATPQV